MYEPVKRVRALKTFPVAPDGVNVLYPTEGQVFDIGASLLPGLLGAKLVEEVEGQEPTPLAEIATTAPGLSDIPHGPVPGVSLGGFPRYEQPLPAIGVASATTPPPEPKEGEEAPLPKTGPDWSDQVAPAAAEEQGGVPVATEPGLGPVAPAATLTTGATEDAALNVAQASGSEDEEKMRQGYENKAQIVEETKEGAPSDGENPEEAVEGESGEAPSTGRRGRKPRA